MKLPWYLVPFGFVLDLMLGRPVARALGNEYTRFRNQIVEIWNGLVVYFAWWSVVFLAIFFLFWHTYSNAGAQHSRHLFNVASAYLAAMGLLCFLMYSLVPSERDVSSERVKEFIRWLRTGARPFATLGFLCFVGAWALVTFDMGGLSTELILGTIYLFPVVMTAAWILDRKTNILYIILAAIVVIGVVGKLIVAALALTGTSAGLAEFNDYRIDRTNTILANVLRPHRLVVLNTTTVVFDCSAQDCLMRLDAKGNPFHWRKGRLGVSDPTQYRKLPNKMIVVLWADRDDPTQSGFVLRHNISEYDPDAMAAEEGNCPDGFIYPEPIDFHFRVWNQEQDTLLYACGKPWTFKAEYTHHSAKPVKDCLLVNFKTHDKKISFRDNPAQNAIDGRGQLTISAANDPACYPLDVTITPNQ